MDMNRLIAERLVNNRMKNRLRESTESAPRSYYKKVKDILNHQLGSYETGVSIDNIDIISETPGTITIKVEYEVNIQIPMIDPEDGRTYYEQEVEYRNRTMTLDFDELDESVQRDKVKLRNIIDTWNMIQKYGIEDYEDHDSYISISRDSYEKMLNGAKNKRYIQNLKMRESNEGSTSSNKNYRKPKPNENLVGKTIRVNPRNNKPGNPDFIVGINGKEFKVEKSNYTFGRHQVSFHKNGGEVILNGDDEFDVVDESANLSNLKAKISIAVEHYMLEEGFPEDEIDDYTALEFENTEDGMRIEVRAELSYEGLMELVDILDPIVQKIDRDAYFEPVTSGIIEAYIQTKIKEDLSLDDDPEETEQQYTSANTSVNSAQLPVIFKLATFEEGSINLDYGGGKFDNASKYLEDTYGATNLVYDKYNRSAEHNKEVLNQVRKNGGADTVTCSNVLNVIAEESERLAVLRNCKRYLKQGGTCYITVYEGNRSGKGAPTKSGYQLNRKTKDYEDEISQVFKVIRKGKLFICK